MSDAKGVLIRQEEAVLLIDEIDDEKTRDLVGALFAALWQETRAGVSPACDFDLEFFARVFIRFAGKHELIKAIVDGGELGSWPD
ncbi:hypothetical protein [Nannocystis pusilla]|uniref:Uncharacterized protein n=1 Tax=Nannocystis pusilla TaxID=889268 RepID=A0ABS7U1K6_9BACT|nr:hypothetical protein [Nannocystis pusilla]MBZ5714335.1 hypothetical protein [Nannocystis pusilla]